METDDGERVMTRGQMISKSKALSASRSVGLSHLGAAVIKNATTVHLAHEQSIRRLELETLWRLRAVDKDVKKLMSRRDRLPVPLLIVERPSSSPIAVALATVPDDDDRLQSRSRGSDRRSYSTGPGYARPTQRSIKTLPLIPSIDAYRIVATRKPSVNYRTASASQNTFDRPAGSLADFRFRSAAMPSWPLSEEEQEELRQQFEKHRQCLYNQRMSARRSSAPSRQSRKAEDNVSRPPSGWQTTPLIGMLKIHEPSSVENPPSDVDVVRVESPHITYSENDEVAQPSEIVTIQHDSIPATVDVVPAGEDNEVRGSADDSGHKTFITSGIEFPEETRRGT